MLITTFVVSFCKDVNMEGGTLNVKIWYLVVCVRCEVLCRLVIAGSDKELHTEHTPLTYSLHGAESFLSS